VGSSLFVPQNFLSLTENNQFRISQLREAANVVGNLNADSGNSRYKIIQTQQYEKKIRRTYYAKTAIR
jgi:hypothetical protein